MKLCLCGCMTPLAGKQRKYSSEACRKRYERLVNSQPQPENGPIPDRKPDKLVVPGVNLSGLASAFPYEDLREFAGHILAMADYEHTWQQRTLAEIARTPGPKHVNQPLSSEYVRLSKMLTSYEKSEQILRWIADQVIEAIGHQVKPHRSQVPTPEWEMIANIERNNAC